MRILWQTDRYHPNLQGFITGLLDYGHNVRMIAYGAWSDEYYDPRLEYCRLKLSRLNIARLSKSKIRRRRYAIPSLRMINRELKTFQPDLVVLKYISGPVLFFSLFCRVRGIPTLLYSPRSPKPTRKHRIRYNILARLGLLPKAYFLVAISGHVTWLLPGEICLPYAMTPDPRARRRTYRTSPPVHVLSVAKLSESRKNNAMLVRSLAPWLRAGQIELTLIGRTQPDNPVYENLRQEIATQQVEAAVTIYTNLERSACLDHYFLADVFVLPSTGEAAGIVILEALAAGLPTICSDTAGLSFCVTEGETGFTFADNDPDDLARKVAYFVDRPAEIARMGQNAVAAVEQQYSPEGFVRRFHDLVRDRLGLAPTD